MMNEGLPGTCKLFLNLYNAELDSEDNVFTKPDEDFVDFIKDAPLVVIPPENVKDIKDNEFDIIKDELEAQIRELTTNNNNLRIAMEQQEEKFRTEMDAYRNEQEQIRNQMRESAVALDRQIQDLRRQNGGRKRSFWGKVVSILGF